MAHTDTAVADKPTAAPQMLGVVPHLVLRDASAAAAFYQRAFGAVEVGRMPSEDGKKLIHCHMHLNGGSLTFMDRMTEEDPPAPQGFDLILSVDDIDAWFERAVKAGAEPVMPPQKMFWGDRYGQVRDPFGVLWSMDEPGAGA
jgi:uncharacterized glyoxalase superfamily protein PhnB